MKKIIILLILLVSLFPIQVLSQSGITFHVPDHTPVSPVVNEFITNTEIPVSEYTGVPQITIPIYTIVEGDLNIHIELSYHASGIRVNEEAGWVGLGWTITQGTIVQVVNDRDDLGDYDFILPDYYNNPYPQQFILRCNWPYSYPCPLPAGFTPSEGPQPYHSYPYFTDYYYPYEGDYNERSEELFNGMANAGPINEIDSEPDVFKASFWGHNVNFLIDNNTDDIVILNQRNYKVSKLSLHNNEYGWEIITPQGDIYTFTHFDETTSEEVRYQFYGPGYSIDDPRIESRVWYIKKIETHNNREITFNYTKTSEIINIPNLSQRFVHKEVPPPTQVNILTFTGVEYREIRHYDNSGISEPYDDHERMFYIVGQSKQTHSYLDNIEFSGGELVFNKSEREDLPGTKKLDNIELVNNSQVKKRFIFSFDYFTGHEVGGNYNDQINNPSQYELSKRLKLQAFYEEGRPPYDFQYFSEQLPLKTSYAIDHWGYYNGQLSNASLIPNPERFDHQNMSGNGNNKSSSLQHSKAAVLEQIDFPTGGYVKFNYELNQFENYWVPDLTSTSNTISSGKGLRIGSIEHWRNSNILALNTKYVYEGGLSFPKQTFFIHYSYHRARQISSGSSEWMRYVVYSYEASSSSYINPSLFGSGNNVGYSKVTKKEMDGSDFNGKTVKYFYNWNDDVQDQAFHVVSLPAFKSPTLPHNGILHIEESYDSEGDLIKRTTNNFSFHMSDLYYGMKTGFWNLRSHYDMGGGNNVTYKEQNLAGYYPIFDGWSDLDSKSTEYWFESSEPVIVLEIYEYDDQGFLFKKESYTSEDKTISEYFYHPHKQAGLPHMLTLIENNRLSPIIEYSKRVNGQTVFRTNDDYSVFNQELVLPIRTYEANSSSFYDLEERIVFDNYDQKGNVIEFHLSNDYHITFLWGYNYTKPIAKIINATYQEVIDALGMSYEDLQAKTSEELLVVFQGLRQNADFMDTEIYSYTYAPFSGLVSETDPNGNSITYEYDDLERLEIIFDSFQNILKYYEYNYIQE